MHWSFLGHAHWFDPTNPYAPLNWYNFIGALGCVAWMAAYVLILRRAHRDKTYGMPLLALCLNITWEGVAFMSPNPVTLWKYIEGIWFTAAHRCFAPRCYACHSRRRLFPRWSVCFSRGLRWWFSRPARTRRCKRKPRTNCAGE